MEMIIGGAYQGKADYAKAQFPDVDWKFGGEITEEELLKAAGVLGFQEYIRKALKAGEDLTGLAEKATGSFRRMLLNGSTEKLLAGCALHWLQKAAGSQEWYAGSGRC